MGKTSENVRKCQSMDLEWNRTGGFRKRQSRESIGVQKDVGRLREMSEMLECGVRNRKTLEYGKHRKTSEMSEYGIGRHRKHQSVK